MTLSSVLFRGVLVHVRNDTIDELGAYAAALAKLPHKVGIANSRFAKGFCGHSARPQIALYRV